MTDQILGFYTSGEVADGVVRNLYKAGFRRSGLLSKSHSGKLTIRRTTYWPVLGSLSAAATAVSLSLHSGIWEKSIVFSMLMSFSVIASFMYRRRYCLDQVVLNNYSRWVLEDETLIIVQAPEGSSSRVTETLNSGSDGSAATFIIRENRNDLRTTVEDRPIREPLTSDALREQAKDFAAQHRLCPPGKHRQYLLEELKESSQILENVLKDVSEGSQLDKRMTPAAEWLLDNAYFIQGQITDIRNNLPADYDGKLPTLDGHSTLNRLRVEVLARDLIQNTDSRLTASNIIEYLQAYQTVAPLTIGELWVFPLLLRFVLVDELKYQSLQVGFRQREKERADFWANRLLAASRRDPDQLLGYLADLARERFELAAHFAVRLAGILYDEEAVLLPVQRWLERKLEFPLQEIIRQEHAHQATCQISIANAIGSLRQLAQRDWRDVFEAVSCVEVILRQDPAGIYSMSDFSTRNRCRDRIEKISHYAGVSEVEVARQAISLAQGAVHPSDSPCLHVGYYLIADGRDKLESRLNCKLPLLVHIVQYVHRHPSFVYLGSLVLLTCLIVTLPLLKGRGFEGPPWELLLLAALSILPASELALQTINLLVSWTLPPRLLPKLLFKDGIPEQHRTLVVVPMMLLTPDSVREEVEKLEVRYLANPDPQLGFALISDLTDAPKPVMPQDQELLELAVRGIRDLNTKYGEAQFFLFSRPRRFCRTQRCWMGWERKRGKIEELNAYLCGEATELLLVVGEKACLGNIRYVLTLDADTQLPHDTARHLVETLAHPLNRPRLSADGRSVVEGFVIIQPRVSITLPSATVTPFTRLFSDPTGSDPYTSAVSDVYQDLFGEGIFHGKAIFDVETFHQILGRGFPDETLLSHDLIEGAHVRVGYASDIELFEHFPVNYQSYMKRQNRWLRGDWQIARWVLPTVPGPDGSAQPNPLSLINRWKILENLRRSLVPAASVALLILSWLLFPASIGHTLIVGLMLVGSSLGFLPSRIAQSLRGTRGVWKEQGRELLRALVSASLLPYDAVSSLDAIVRVWYRKQISHLYLLEWESAQESHWKVLSRLSQSVIHLTFVSLGTASLTLLLYKRQFNSWHIAAPFLTLWLISPAIADWMNSHRRENRNPRISGQDRRFLRQIACQTWRFFDDLVGPSTHWLPPDNSQESLRIEVAQRTSPTNIGLWLLSALGACDLGYITRDQMVDRTHRTLETMAALERFEGHLLNWYDIQNLQPLRPPYVSTVDSGNLLACLWILEQGYHDCVVRPLIGPESLHALADRLELLCAAMDREDQKDQTIRHALEVLNQLLQNPPDELEEIIGRVRRAASPVERLTQSLHLRLPPEDERVYLATKLMEGVVACTSIIDRYLHWFEILVDLPEDICSKIDRNLLKQVSLEMLVSDKVSSCILKASTVDSNLSREVFDKCLQALSSARNLALEAVEKTEHALQQARMLEEQTNMKFLYDNQRRLFTIGYNVSTRSRDTSYYDLLASEARVASLVAIARREVPAEHWLALGRPYGTVDGKAVLLSWSGTMFEYLMPLLFTETLENSLLDYSCRAAVNRQIEYGRQRGIPWGISESAFSALDANRVYQYRAFGVPGLGLKRGLEEELVVAPYATCLALTIKPFAAIRNLRRLEKLGVRGAKGFYESVDYSRQQRPEGERGVIIYAYMCHHQGMILLAIDNLLRERIIQRRFHDDLRVRATESLFFERIPATSSEHISASPEPPPVRLIAAMPSPLDTRRCSENTQIPRVQLLSNGSFSVMLTNAGGGYIRWRDFEINRWRADTTTDAWGSYCYIRDRKSGAFWSTTFHPVDRPERRYSACFTADRVEFRRRDADIETVMEVVVSPEDDAEIRRITLTNLSSSTRHLDLTSYVELALAPHNADRAHPAFSKIFVETEALPQQNALLAWRRPRSPEDPPIWAAHVVASLTAFEGEVEYETNRTTFLGRGRSLKEPEAMKTALLKQSGAVLDPIFSLRCRIVVRPNHKIRLAFVTLAAETRDQLLAMVKKYQELPAANRALELAWTHAQLELRYLGLQTDEAQIFQDLGSHMIFPNRQLRAPAERLRRNSLGQARLWAHGISGDLPIFVVLAGDSNDLGVVRESILAHTFWRIRGLKADLVILNEENLGYEQPLFHQLTRLVQASSLHTGIDRPGGVFLRSVERIPEEDLTLLLASARVVLVAARGSLAQQLGSAAETIELLPRLEVTSRLKADSPVPFSPMDLHFYNQIGGFTQDGREYVIQLDSQEQTPAPWVNILANPHLGTLVTESGPGFLWSGNSQTNRQTPWSNDPLSLVVTEGIYLRDEESGAVWSPTTLPVRTLHSSYRIRHGQGYTVFEHNSHGIEQELITFVPLDSNFGKPVRVQSLQLRNISRRRRPMSVTTYAEWTLGTDREETQTHIVTSWDASSHTLLARNNYNPEFSGKVAFATLSPRVQSFTGDRTEFLGRNHSSSGPAALERKRLSCHVGAGLDPCAALQVQIVLEPDEVATVIYLIGQADDLTEVRKLVEHFRNPRSALQSLIETQNWWNEFLGTVQVQTPDLSVNFMVNRWLLYQTLSCRMWARSAFYQSGGAFGFRDQLQDIMALVYAAPTLAREHILRAAGRQFVEGDVQHWWHPSSGVGIRSRCSDDLLWLPYALAHYVNVTGDTSILEERVPFLDGRPLEENENEAYILPKLAMEDGSLFDHCWRAIQKGSTRGPHGLPLIGSCDWNDGMNRVGVKGRGESVWLAWFLIEVLRSFIPICELQRQEGPLGFCRQRIEELTEAVEAHGWDGEWYCRAFFDDGTPLGSKANEEAVIDSLPQSWAVISGVADKKRALQALNSVERLLVRAADKLVLLYTPPFNSSRPHPGYIMGYPPGVRENGGQYTHAAIWVAMAFARIGDAVRCVELLRMLNPIEHSRTSADVSRYQGEPYVVAADIYTLDGQVGRSGWTWYTGSSGWMYRVWLEEVLGFKQRSDTLIIDPTIPSEWTNYSLNYRFHGTSYELVIENPEGVNHGVVSVELDGELLKTVSVPLRNDGLAHHVRVILGTSGSVD